MVTEFVGLIPARSGSKRVKNKNIRVLCGKPCIGYTIESSVDSLINRTFVSTDSKNIAEISETFGAEVPFLRPAKFAQDDSADIDVILHFLGWLSSLRDIDNLAIVFLRPTMPLRTSAHIDSAIAEFKARPTVDCLRTVTPTFYPPYWIKRVDEQGNIIPFTTDVEKFQYARSQDLPPTYFCDGYVDIAWAKSIIKHKKFPCGQVVASFLNAEQFVDIDHEHDFAYAEYLLKSKMTQRV